MQAGARVGPYEVLSLLGQGGMGRVWRARDGRLEREVALKVLSPALAVDEGARARFLQEARAAAAVRHPNVLAVLDVGEERGAPYVVSELLEGETLRARLGPGPLPLAEAVEVAAQVARGVAAAHECGLVHGDLKPENVFLSRSGHVKVLDFGLATRVPPASAAAEATSDDLEAERGPLRGTASYLSPEQVRREPLDARSDVFALGALLDEMTTGRPTFRRPTLAETLSAVLEHRPHAEGPVLSGLAGAVREVALRCLAKRPEERFASAHDVALALEAILRGVAAPPAPAAGRGFTHRLLPALGAFALALAVYAWLRPGAPAPRFQALTFRRGLVFSGRWLPDGQTVAYSAAWDDGARDIFVARLDSPDAAPLALPPRTRLVSARAGELAVVVPRGSFEPTGVLTRVPVQGGAPRAVAEDVTDADYLPDGSGFVVVRRQGGRDRLEFPAGVVRAESAGWFETPRVSPDGTRVAVVEHASRADAAGVVCLLSRDGSRRDLTVPWPDVSGLAWPPRGDEVWFTASEPGGRRALRAVSLTGSTRLLAQVPGSLELQDVGPGGRVLLTHWHGRVETRGRAPGEAAERELGWLDATQAADLSPDGTTLLFGESGEGGGPRHSAYLRPTAGGRPVRLGDGVPRALAPDGSRVLVEAQGRFALLPTGAGEPQPLAVEPLVAVPWATWLPDGRRLLLLGNERGRPLRLYTLDPAAGPPRPLAPEGTVTWANTSTPDGRALVVRSEGKPPVLWPLDGGEARPVPGVAAGERVLRVAADGRSAFVRTAAALPGEVVQVDLRDGSRRPWLSLAPPDRAGVTGLSAVLLSADGGAYAYSYRRVLAELYLAEGIR